MFYIHICSFLVYRIIIYTQKLLDANKKREKIKNVKELIFKTSYFVWVQSKAQNNMLFKIRYK